MPVPVTLILLFHSAYVLGFTSTSVLVLLYLIKSTVVPDRQYPSTLVQVLGHFIAALFRRDSHNVPQAVLLTPCDISFAWHSLQEFLHGRLVDTSLAFMSINSFMSASPLTFPKIRSSSVCPYVSVLPSKWLEL